LGFRSGKKHDVGVLMGEFFGQTKWIGHRLPRLFFWGTMAIKAD
jgi:hypothetical protein